jgi:hypothetical protein
LRLLRIVEAVGVCRASLLEVVDVVRKLGCGHVGCVPVHLRLCTRQIEMGGRIVVCEVMRAIADVVASKSPLPGGFWFFLGSSRKGLAEIDRGFGGFWVLSDLQRCFLPCDSCRLLLGVLQVRVFRYRGRRAQGSRAPVTFKMDTGALWFRFGGHRRFTFTNPLSVSLSINHIFLCLSPGGEKGRREKDGILQKNKKKTEPLGCYLSEVARGPGFAAGAAG